jgi:hypothetical protein
VHLFLVFRFENVIDTTLVDECLEEVRRHGPPVQEPPACIDQRGVKDIF